ncbi:MAG: tRNA (N6-isopentenyl adenosine(37)-C2)-methylthiotransferase MiaB [Bacteroidota bacterium]|nr:tRNA (N6-isopentenyl adenosine(37)-C2)-methylthiotransferase MiaB [Candidatus Kapabacteria bacterium]MDW8219261.1 tRNA (N6-isopentenyl adenosine(37)-C2)-methylthiotransferase MiaB [Bacteroidota bacterium]
MIELPIVQLPLSSPSSHTPVSLHTHRGIDTQHHIGGTAPKVYVETYGCQMNVSDSEIVRGIMQASGYALTNTIDDADVIFLNTCAIRDNAERKIHERLMHLKYYKKRNRALVVGVLGCMAERMRQELIETKQIVDIVVGPDEYRKLPELVRRASFGEKGIAVKLSRVETYDDIEPLRTDGISAWITIMRGCDKFCTFCVVPFTRGRERSRSARLIVDEAQRLWDSGFKEITLLGQNVNSYYDPSSDTDFADLLRMTARAVPQMRIRYTTSHPYDMSNKLIATMAEHNNICKYIHLPVQSGSDRILQAMNRHYSVEHYKERIRTIRTYMPHCALSTDIIVGFPTETLEDHRMTVELMEEIRYDGAYMFLYSPRERTKAWKMPDDVPHEEKVRRLNEIIDQQQRISHEINQQSIGTIEQVLVEGPSRRNPHTEWQGRTDTNKVVIFPHRTDAAAHTRLGYAVGNIVHVQIERASSASLFGQVVG